MKKFTKLALASSILAMSASTMAMTALDDASLSATTGQEGITIGVQIDEISIGQVLIHDNDGLRNMVNNPLADDQNANYDPTAPAQINAGVAGAIVINNLVVTNKNAGSDLITLDIDADGSADGAFLNIGATIAALDVNMDEIEVAQSGTYTSSTNSRGSTANRATILNSLGLSLGAITANIQLGNTPQGAMIELDSTIGGGLTINALSLADNGTNGQGSIDIDSIRITDAASNDLTVDASVNVTPTGLAITARQGTAGQNIYMTNVDLGGTGSSIGDIEIVGMKTTSAIGAGTTIRITGH